LQTCEAQTCEAQTCEAQTCEAQTCEAQTCKAQTSIVPCGLFGVDRLTLNAIFVWRVNWHIIFVG